MITKLTLSQENGKVTAINLYQAIVVILAHHSAIQLLPDVVVGSPDEGGGRGTITTHVVYTVTVVRQIEGGTTDKDGVNAFIGDGHNISITHSVAPRFAFVSWAADTIDITGHTTDNPLNITNIDRDIIITPPCSAVRLRLRQPDRCVEIHAERTGESS